MAPKLRPCDKKIAAARLSKARRFLASAKNIEELADDPGDVADSSVSMCVLAAIAASDAICCLTLGEHAQGDNHNEAAAHLAKVKPDSAELAKALRVCLGLKTKAGYGDTPVSATDRKRVMRAATRLVDAAVDRSATK